MENTESVRNTRWSKSEDDLLLEIIQTGRMNTQEIAQKLGRSEKAVWARTKKLKLQGRLEDRKYVSRKMGPVQEWTLEDELILWNSYFAGNMTLEAIGELLGRSLSSVKNRLAKMRKEYNEQL